MHIDEVIETLVPRPVVGFPQLRLVEPSINDLGELAERFTDWSPTEDGEAAGESLIWLFERFIRDAEGQPIQGLDSPEMALQKIRPSMVQAVNASLRATEVEEGPTPVPGS